MGIILIIALVVALSAFFFRFVSREDYTFLTIDENSGDLKVVDGGGKLEVDEQTGNLKSTSGFHVSGDLITTGKVNGIIGPNGDLKVESLQIGDATLTENRLKALNALYSDDDDYVRYPFGTSWD